MRTAVDTSVVLDVLGGDPKFGAASREALRRAYDTGGLVASDVVWAEVRAHFAADDVFSGALAELGVQFVPTSAEAAALAGQLWQKHRAGQRRAGVGTARVVADLLVGAHALKHADVLLTRDRGFYRAYFRGLRILEPKS